MAPHLTDAFGKQLEALLHRQLGRIRQRFFLHGLGNLLWITATAVILYYPLDRLLRLPAGVRIFLTLGAAALSVWAAQRYLLYPLRRTLTRRDVALAIEQRFPDLQQKLISAIQLGRAAATADATGPRNQSRAMIEALIHDAAEHAGRIPHDQLLSPRQTAKVWSTAAVLLLLVFGFGVANPGTTGVFLQRILGMNANYPRDTYLVLVQPAEGSEASPEFRVQKLGKITKVTLAAGGDLPVLVRADHTAPREVDLIVTGGRGLPPKVAMSARQDKHFKYTFRRISQGFSFYPVGGDDQTAEQRVEVTVLVPPRVQQVRAVVAFPAYTRKPSPPVQEGSVEALIGSKVRFDVETTKPVVTARLRLLESGTDIELTPVKVADGDAEKTVYRGSINVTRSDRYQIELVGKEGLQNPRPDTYQIVASPDHPPVGKLLSPLDDGLNVSLPDGMIPVRVYARDDYGLSHVDLIVQPAENAAAIRRALFTPAAEPTSEPVRERYVLTFLDLVTAEFKKHATVGSALILSLELRDNREPEPAKKTVGPRQVRVIGETDLQRRIAAHFRRVRDDVDQNHKLLLDRNERLEDLIEEAGTEITANRLQIGITSIEVAQGRIRTAAARIHVELMRAFNVHLFNRLEPSAHAGTVLELFRTFHSQATEPRSFFPAFYRDLSKRRAEGKLGAMDKALDPILQMIDAADKIAETLAPEALKLLAAARVAEGNKAAAATLGEASKKQRSMIEEFNELLKRLDRWNEFQDVITNTRSILDKQRDIKARTETLQGGKGK